MRDCGIHVWNHTSDEKEYSIKEEQSRLISARSSRSLLRRTVSRVWKGREIQKRRPGPRWKAMRNLSEMTSARPSSPAKGLIPEESRIVCGKKREPCCATPSFFPSSLYIRVFYIYIYICAFYSPFFLFFTTSMMILLIARE